MGEETYGGKKAIRFALENGGLNIQAMSEDNEYLFSATIGKVFVCGEELRIDLRRGKEIPETLEERDKIKLVTKKKKSDHMFVIKGEVTEVGKTFIYVTLNDVEEYIEGRKHFRLPIRNECFVRRSDGSQRKELTADISLTGICIISADDYEPGEEITVEDLQIIDEGRLYTLPARVVRKNGQRDEMTGKNKYGCCFENLTEREEDMLCHDIFALQQKKMRAREI